MLDPQGNYYAALPDEDRGSGTGSISTIGSGIGAPGVGTKATTIYVDVSTGAIYSYVSGAWVAQGGAGSNGQIVIYTSGTPANPSDLTKPALAYDPNGFQPILGWGTVSHTWGAS